MAEPFIGEIRSFAFGIIPSDFLPCNGQLLMIQRYQALYSILGTNYGGDGTTTFALPNLQGRAPIHPSNDDVWLGQSFGEETHTLTVQEIPQHTHQVQGSSTATTVNPSGTVWGTPQKVEPYSTKVASPVTMNREAIANSGANAPHNNMQPYTVLQFCIAYRGEYPQRP